MASINAKKIKMNINSIISKIKGPQYKMILNEDDINTDSFLSTYNPATNGIGQYEYSNGNYTVYVNKNLKKYRCFDKVLSPKHLIKKTLNAAYPEKIVMKLNSNSADCSLQDILKISNIQEFTEVVIHGFDLCNAKYFDTLLGILEKKKAIISLFLEQQDIENNQKAYISDVLPKIHNVYIHVYKSSYKLEQFLESCETTNCNIVFVATIGFVDKTTIEYLKESEYPKIFKPIPEDTLDAVISRYLYDQVSENIAVFKNEKFRKDPLITVEHNILGWNNTDGELIEAKMKIDGRILNVKSATMNMLYEPTDAYTLFIDMTQSVYMCARSNKEFKFTGNFKKMFKKIQEERRKNRCSSMRRSFIQM